MSLISNFFKEGCLLYITENRVNFDQVCDRMHKEKSRGEGPTQRFVGPESYSSV